MKSLYHIWYTIYSKILTTVYKTAFNHLKKSTLLNKFIIFSLLVLMRKSTLFSWREISFGIEALFIFLSNTVSYIQKFWQVFYYFCIWNAANQERLSLKSFGQPQLYRPLTIGCMMMFLQQFVGINAILFFCDEIFRTAGIKWNASILAACTLFAFTIVACLIVDMFGRRILLLCGSVVMFICMFLLGVYYDLAKIDGNDLSIFGHVSHTIAVSKISWLAILCVMLYIAMFAIGWGPLPWVLMGELFPPNARGQASSMVTLVNLVFTFVIAKTFSSFKKELHQQGTFWFYAGFCVVSFIYTLFFVPETKGKSLEEIERTFNPGSTQFEYEEWFFYRWNSFFSPRYTFKTSLKD